MMDHFYRDALEHCQTFNSRLMAERQVRIPYLDSQTGVAQNKCNLSYEKKRRGPGLMPNQIYTYPSKHWKKNPSTALSDPILGIFGNIKEPKESRPALNSGLFSGNGDGSTLNDNSNDSNLFEFGSDSPAAIREQEYQDDDDDYYDEDRPKKRMRKGKGRGGRPPKRLMEVFEHSCDYCGKKYKNVTGLNFHIQHIHQEELEGEDEYVPNTNQQSPSIVDENSNSASGITKAHSTTSVTSSRTGSMAGSISNAGADDDDKMEARSTRAKGKQKSKNDYCDFCLGGSEKNMKTGGAEELVSCSDCGRSGHPTCLQFTTIMTRNVKQYQWQCIECKSCHLCGTSDNDDQLLFCDDCDRGYHMYCLDPPMQEPPEGSWICKLCTLDRKQRAKEGLPIE